MSAGMADFNMSAAELAAVESLGLTDILRAAIVWRAGQGTFTYGAATPTTEAELAWAIDDFIHGGQEENFSDGVEAPPPVEQPQWIERPIKDARVGDVIRPSGDNGNTTGSKVTDRYLPPELKNAGSWHVVPGQGSHWTDHVVRPGEVWLCFDGEEKPRNLKPDFMVEILMTPSEINSIEMFGGWDERLDGECP